MPPTHRNVARNIPELTKVGITTRAVALLALVNACGGTSPSPSVVPPTPRIVYITQPPSSATAPAPRASRDIAVLDPVLTAPIDGGDWEITHRVTESSYPALAVGDLTIRVYQKVKYLCAAGPCDVGLNTDDPNTVDQPRPARFRWQAGSYVSAEVQTAIGRCEAPDGSVVPDAYDVSITTTLRVTEIGNRDGAQLATKLVGDQVRDGQPRRDAAAHGCPSWRARFKTTGQRNVTPGQATTVRYRNWAGYVVARDGVRITDVRGSWTQPAIRCDGAATQMSSYWIGIDGSSNDTLEQLGTEADCRDGRATYAAWWETIPEPQIRTDLEIRPGDQLRASIHSSGDRYTMSLRNDTTGGSFSKTVDWPAAEGASAEWIAEATSLCRLDECEVQVLPDFGSVHFTDAEAGTGSADLRAPSDPAWQLERALMITRGGRTKAEVSPFAAGGDAFTVTWRPLS